MSEDTTSGLTPPDDPAERKRYAEGLLAEAKAIYAAMQGLKPRVSQREAARRAKERRAAARAANPTGGTNG